MHIMRPLPEKETKMDKRYVTKYAVKTIVMFAAGDVISKALAANVPATQKLRANDAIGAVGGYVLSEKLAPTTDKLVDDFFDKRQAR